MLLLGTLHVITPDLVDSEIVKKCFREKVEDLPLPMKEYLRYQNALLLKHDTCPKHCKFVLHQKPILKQ